MGMQFKQLIAETGVGLSYIGITEEGDLVRVVINQDGASVSPIIVSKQLTKEDEDEAVRFVIGE